MLKTWAEELWRRTRATYRFSTVSTVPLPQLYRTFRSSTATLPQPFPFIYRNSTVPSPHLPFIYSFLILRMVVWYFSGMVEAAPPTPSTVSTVGLYRQSVTGPSRGHMLPVGGSFKIATSNFVFHKS